MKSIGVFRMSGLMIGPILGSGIVILPPLAYQTAGGWALAAWAVMMAMGFLFAFVFGGLYVRFPGDAGMANAVQAAFGVRAKRLTSLYLIGAVFFGPVAVLVTAAKFVPVPGLSPAQSALAYMLVCVLINLRPVSFIGSLGFAVSTLAALTLGIGSISTLIMEPSAQAALPAFDAPSFGYTLLLLFWCIVGWEVIGNFTADVKDLQRTIPRAVGLSALIISALSLLVAAAVQGMNPAFAAAHGREVSALLVPVFGSGGRWLLAVLVLALCMITYVAFTGSVARLAASLAREGFFPAVLGRKNRAGAPAAALAGLSVQQGVMFVLVIFGVFSVEDLVAMADAFFIANALTGLAAAWRVLSRPVLKYGALGLTVPFFIILSGAEPVLILIIMLMAAGAVIPLRSKAAA